MTMLRLLPILLAAALPAQAHAQGWFSDRFDNAIANVDQITARYRNDLREELERAGVRPPPLPTPTAAEQAAVRSLRPWWQQAVVRPIEPGGRAIPVSLAYMYDSAILYSAQLRVFGDLPAIRDLQEAEVAGRYVPRGFAEGRIGQVNDPTRSLANTLGSERLLRNEVATEFGLRQRLITGGEVTMGQRFLNFSTNSVDFVPQRQTVAQSFITIVQPLLRDSGTAYVRSIHEVARVDARVAQSEFRRQAENHLLEVARAYWTLHLARVTLLVKERLVAQVRPIVAQLEARRGIDADGLLLNRARTALATREAEVLRARAGVRNAEVRLRGLVNDPRFGQQGITELMPSDTPLDRYEPIGLATVLERAIALRPEVHQLYLQHRAAVLREGQAQVEALPRLDIVLEGTQGGRGLGRYQFGEAFDRYNNLQRPGGTIGLRLEVPLQSDDLAARLERRRLETRQVESQGRATLATIVAESEVTLNEYNVAFREVAARALAMRAAQTEVNIQTERFRQGVGSGLAGATALDLLLQAQERLAEAEERVAAAQVGFTLAFLVLARVQGTFTSLENLDVRKIDDAARGPSYVLQRSSAAEGRSPQPAPRNGRTP
ncbi:TolC family protein [Elioraea tepida]|uniref:TolC family protein n=1 Tax=Elioraea tepida TaxID=2843330 RepID=A0A975U0X9_9PROT|nr:TolC family protein [Elioraea tepida]QXM23659.1 TolC family protein [Elioraea tepida]